MEIGRNCDAVEGSSTLGRKTTRAAERAPDAGRKSCSRSRVARVELRSLRRSSATRPSSPQARAQSEPHLVVRDRRQEVPDGRCCHHRPIIRDRGALHQPRPVVDEVPRERRVWRCSPTAIQHRLGRILFPLFPEGLDSSVLFPPHAPAVPRVALGRPGAASKRARGTARSETRLQEADEQTPVPLQLGKRGGTKELAGEVDARP